MVRLRRLIDWCRDIDKASEEYQRSNWRLDGENSSLDELLKVVKRYSWADFVNRRYDTVADDSTSSGSYALASTENQDSFSKTLAAGVSNLDLSHLEEILSIVQPRVSSSSNAQNTAETSSQPVPPNLMSL